VAICAVPARETSDPKHWRDRTLPHIAVVKALQVNCHSAREWQIARIETLNLID
jgi:hypothetical protein